MKKLLFTLTSILFVFSFSRAQTIVGGSISTNTTWTLSGSPYIVQSSNIAVMNGATLTIDAGVTVKFNTVMAIQVFGCLRALGTSTQPVTFTSNNPFPAPGDWGYILFNNNSTPYNFLSNTGSLLQYCIIEYAGGSNASFNGIVRLDNASPYIDNCSIKHCNKQAIKIWNLTGKVFINGCTIQNNTADTGIVYISGTTSARATITYSTISNNSDGVYSKACNLSIKNCNISSNSGNGITGIEINTVTDTIFNNIISHNINGLKFNNFTNSNFSITDNTIESNIENGIYLNNFIATSSNTFTITDNAVNNNTQNGVYFSYNNYGSISNIYIIRNNSLNNNMQNGISYYYASNANNSTYSIVNNSMSNNAQNGLYQNYSSNSYNNTYTITGNTLNNNTLNGLCQNYNSSYYNTYTITGNTLKNNTLNGIYQNHSFAAFNNTYLFSENLLDNNAQNGYYYAYSQTYNNTYSITKNIISNNNQNGFYNVSFTNYTGSYNNIYNITNNTFNKNQGNGIYALSIYNGTASNPLNVYNISKNKIIENTGVNGGGIRMESNAINTGTNVNITQNIIANNKVSGQGGGVFLDIVKGTITLTNNSIINNYGSITSAVHIKSQGYVTANYNTIVYNRATDPSPTSAVYIDATNIASNPQFRYNNIYNSACDEPFYDFWFSSFNGDSLIARDCYWQKSTNLGVDSVIYDYFNSSNLGIVWFSPFASVKDTTAPVTPVLNIIKTDLGGGNIQISWSPNSETDIAGYKIYWGAPTGYSFANSIDVGNVNSYILSGVQLTDTIGITAYDIHAGSIDDQLKGNESWFFDITNLTSIIAPTDTTTFCQGDSVVLDAQIGIGLTYQWENNGGIINGATNSSYTANQSGTYTVDVSNGCSITSFPVNVIVNPLPANAGIISCASTVCPGQNAAIYTVPVIANATSYIWTLPTGATGTSTTNSITVDFDSLAISGNITVAGHNPCGDGAPSSLAISINPLPENAGVITGSETVCQGQSAVTYTVSAIANATSYLWTLPTGATGTSTTNSITVDFDTLAISGNITVLGVNTCGNGIYASLYITVNNIPPTPTITINGGTLQSDAASGNQWYLQDTLINNATNQNYNVLAYGNYYVIVTLLGCSSDTSNIINVIHTGVELLEKNSNFSVYPNPATNKLIFEIQREQIPVNSSIKITDIQGKILLQQTIKQKHTQINISTFAEGMYFFSFESIEGIVVRSFIKN